MTATFETRPRSRAVTSMAPRAPSANEITTFELVPAKQSSVKLSSPASSSWRTNLAPAYSIVTGSLARQSVALMLMAIWAAGRAAVEISAAPQDFDDGGWMLAALALERGGCPPIPLAEVSVALGCPVSVRSANVGAGGCGKVGAGDSAGCSDNPASRDDEEATTNVVLISDRMSPATFTALMLTSNRPVDSRGTRTRMLGSDTSGTAHAPGPI